MFYGVMYIKTHFFKILIHRQNLKFLPVYLDLLGHVTMQSGKWVPMFWANIMPPSSGLNQTTRCHNPEAHNISVPSLEHLRSHIAHTEVRGRSENIRSL
jgi:hypothetical protein